MPHMKRFAIRFTALWILAVFLTLTALPAFAVDPMPEEIEKASQEVQDAWIQKRAEESLEQKIEVGKRRFEERKQLKKEWAQHLRASADFRREELRTETETRQSDLERSARHVRISLGITILLMAASGTAYGIHRVLKPAKPEA